MSGAIMGLTAGFLLLAGLVILLLLQTGLAHGYKLTAIIALTLFYWIQYHSLQRYAGWPTGEPLPDEFVLIASEVVEPNSTTGESGRLYWWIRESSDTTQPPRVYELPYTKPVHRQSAEVLAAQRQGGQFVGRQSRDRHGAQDLGISFEQVSKAQRHRKK